MQGHELTGLNMRDQNTPINRNIIRLVAVCALIICAIAFFFSNFDKVMGLIPLLVSILMPFICGAVIAYLLAPIVRQLEGFLTRHLDKNGTGKHQSLFRNISIAVSLLVLLLLLFLLLMAVLPEVLSSITRIVREIPGALENFTEWLHTLDTNETAHTLITNIEAAVDTVSSYISNFLEKVVIPNMETMVSRVTSSFISIFNVLKNFGLGCIISAYLLGSQEKFAAQVRLILYAILPVKGADWVLQEARVVDKMLIGFVYGKLLDSAIIGFICFVFTLVTRMPYGLLVSIIVGVTNIIPFFGPYLGAVPSAILILTVSPEKCLLFIVFIIILQQIDGNVLGPKILGDRLGLSAFWILFSILLFGALWGVIGMLIGAPLFAVLYDLVRRFIISRLKKKGKDSLTKAYTEQFYPTTSPEPAPEESSSSS